MITISFKVSEDEAQRIRKRAKQQRLSLSEYLRRRATDAVEAAPVGKIRCDITGAEIFAPLSGSSNLSTETVRQMLAEFP
jgi:hypothetical protein